MPRKREGTVNESLEELGALEDRYRGKPEEVRITVLKLLKEDEERGIEDVANMVGYSKPTVKRWWRSYREGGIDKLLGIAVPTRPAPEVDENLNVLKQKLIAGEFDKIEDVRSWLEAHIQPSRRKPGVRLSTNAILESADTQRRTIRHERETEGIQALTDRPDLLAEKLLGFLSALPDTHSIQKWTDAFRSALRALLGDVDHISITVNVRCDLLNPEAYQPDLVISQSFHNGARTVNPFVESGIKSKNEDAHLERTLDNLRGGKFPFDKYHPPACFVYYYLERAFLGVILLWRERSRPSISGQSMMLMERLTSFMGYILSDFAARYQAANPVEHVFDQALIGLTRETGLTMQERRIIVLQLLGLSYDEVATTLSISLNTVRYHLRSIYQKTATHSLAELFAKYFTPRLDPEHSSE